MTTNIITEEDFFKKLAEKTSSTVEDLKVEFEEVIKEVQSDEKFTAYNDDQKRNVARNKFGFRKMREASSNAIAWEGIIVGVGDLVDTVAKQKRVTEAAFKADPLKTVQGWIFNTVLVSASKNGTPLYPKTDGNTKFGRSGKPLPEHSWLRTLYMIARPIDPKTKQAGPVQLSKLRVNNAPAIDMSKIPLMTPVKFKAINKTADADRMVGEYSMNFSTYTKFEPTTISGMPAIENLLAGVATHYESLGGLEVYHTNNEQDPRRLVITEGTVANMNLEPNAKTGNVYLIVTDESMLFSATDRTGVMCWIPTDRNIQIDFGVESRVFIVGKTTRGKAKDPITGDILEGVPGDVMLNVYGLYAPELFKVSPNAVAITEKSVVAITEPIEEENPE